LVRETAARAIFRKEFFTEVSTLEKRGLAMQILKGDFKSMAA
jgi:hypothetical protein